MPPPSLTFVLDGNTPIPYPENLAWTLSPNRVVRLTRLGPAEVSTIFFGINIHLSTPPRLFETKVDVGSNDPQDVDLVRHSATWEEAEARHQAIVDQLRALYPDAQPTDVEHPNTLLLKDPPPDTLEEESP